jgi:hypothetical protein
MANLTTYTTNKLEDHFHGKVAWSLPSLWVGVSTTLPTVAGANITEPTIGTGGYARIQVSGLSFTSSGSGTSATIPTASTTGIVVGMAVTGAGITAGTNITVVSLVANTSVTLSSSITYTATAYACTFFNYAASGSASNSGTVAFPQSTAAWSTTTTNVAYTCYFDASTSGNLLMFDAITVPQAVNAANIVLQYTAGQLTDAIA